MGYGMEHPDSTKFSLSRPTGSLIAHNIHTPGFFHRCAATSRRTNWEFAAHHLDTPAHRAKPTFPLSLRLERKRSPSIAILSYHTGC